MREILAGERADFRCTISYLTFSWEWQWFFLSRCCMGTVTMRLLGWSLMFRKLNAKDQAIREMFEAK